MKFSAMIPRSNPLYGLLLFPIFIISNTFANSIIAGGYVPEQRSLSVTPSYGADNSPSNRSTEVAVIEIDNNLPNYELVLDFSDRYGDKDIVAEVRLQCLDGVLGSGSLSSSGTVLIPGAAPGQFIWSPGPQMIPTHEYRVKVMVTYRRPMTGTPTLRVSMPSSY